MRDLDYLKSCAEELGLRVEDLKEDNLTECVRLTLSPRYISTDIAGLVHAACNRSGVVVSGTYVSVAEARKLFDTVAKYIQSVMNSIPKVEFYLLACVGFPDHPEYEDLIRLWVRFEATIHKINEEAMAEWLPFFGKEGEPSKFLLMATIPDENSFITEETLSAIIDEQDKLMNPFLAEFNAGLRKGSR